jgi:hypothetical protein
VQRVDIVTTTGNTPFVADIRLRLPLKTTISLLWSPICGAENGNRKSKEKPMSNSNDASANDTYLIDNMWWQLVDGQWIWYDYTGETVTSGRATDRESSILDYLSRQSRNEKKTREEVTCLTEELLAMRGIMYRYEKALEKIAGGDIAFIEDAQAIAKEALGDD